jgi:nucleotide-binding universal stress UspA family protein
MRIERVLCPVDFSDVSRRALRHAGSIAAWYEAELHVLHALVPMPSVGMSMGSIPAVQPGESADALAQALTVFVAESGLPVEARQRVVEGPAAAVILDIAREVDASLLVIGTHGRSGLDHALIGSVAERVVQKATCPVLTVPPGGDDPGTSSQVRFTHVLCAIDFSPPSIRALQHALSLAQENQARLTLVHALETLSDEEARMVAHFNVGEYITGRKQDAIEQLRRLVPDEARSWCDVQEMVGLGPAGRVVLEQAAALGADLIVMGSRGRSTLGLMFFGSSTQTVVRRATCPVLTTRE